MNIVFPNFSLDFLNFPASVAPLPTDPPGSHSITIKERPFYFQNMVFYILCKEKGKPIHKKGELMKAVNLNGKRKDDQDEVLDRFVLRLFIARVV